ncbi:MAG: GT-D fold domain-containing protein [Lachnospiraceae bacterium]|nr:GT-D fold domain-containing protein [Lachnospiraceae bacterium]
MKKLIKKILAQITYLFYRLKLGKCNVKVMSVDKMIEELGSTTKSLVRFGDSDMTIVWGRSVFYQQASPEMIEGLRRILRYDHDDLMVSIPDIFGDLNIYRKESKAFWMEHLFFCRKVYKKYCNPNREYCNTSFTRFYYPLADKSQCGRQIEAIRQLWKDRDIVVVEGEKTHNGVGNDLLDTAKSVERIIGPSAQAYDKVDEIFACCKEYPKDRLFLLSLGIGAKFLAERLFLDGYRVLDIGNLDMEYEWYLRGAKYKEKLAKHEVVGEEANQKAGYQEYLAQIKKKII